MALLLNTPQIRAVLGKLSMNATQAISGATDASPAVINVVNHGLSVGDVVYQTGVGGNTNCNCVGKVASVVDANHYTLTDLHTGSAINGNAAYTSGGTAQRIFAGLIPHNLLDLQRSLDSTKYVEGTDADFVAQESTIQSIFGA